MTCRWLICGMLSMSFAAFGQQSAAVQIDARKVVHAVPRTIFSGFMEPLRSATYGGGIWAQLLENPSFEENLWRASAIVHMVQARPELIQSSGVGLPIPWESLDPRQGNRFEPRWGDAANSSRSLLIMALPGRQTGVRQAVYPPVQRVLRYTGSIWAKPVSGGRQLELSLRRRDRRDEVLAKVQIDLAPGGWKRYEYALELPKGALAPRQPVDFVVAVSDETRVLIDQVLLYPADHIDGLNPEAVEMTKALKLPLLRFGGNYTSGYHWRDGVGPIDKRVSTLNVAWGQPEYNHFGTDEFLRFCQLTGAQPQICLNLGGGTVEEAVEWVKYVNARWGDKSGGLTWELGNELWGNFQIGYPTLERLAARTREFSEAVRKVDPRIKLIATGQDPDRFEKWNAAQLALGPGYYDYLATHLVVDTNSVRKPNPSPEFLAEAVFAVPVGIERMLREMRKQIDADPRMKGTGLALTEWLFRAPFSSAPPDLAPPRIPEHRNLGGAIAAAGILNMLIRVADFTPIANMTSIVEYGRLWEKRGVTYGVPSYWALRMYTNAEVANLLDTQVESPRYSVQQGQNRSPEVPEVPYLDVVGVANQAGDKITLFAVNRHLNEDIPANIMLAGFNVASASGKVLSAADIYVGNDDANPEAVVPKDIALAVSGSQFTHVFPKSSVSVLELRATTPAPTFANIDYAPPEPAGSNGHKLDLYIPAGAAAPIPVVVWTGGSAWRADTGKNTARGIAAWLNPVGYAVAGVSIRSSSQVLFPGQLHDIKAAIRWLRANAAKYNLDPDHIAIMGDSSGGWTTAMAAVTGDAPEMEGSVGTTGASSAVQAAVAFYPPTNFTTMDAWAIKKCAGQECHDSEVSPESRLVGCAIQTCPDKVKAASPLTYVSAADPPMMILHGNSDPLVPHHQGEQLYMALNKACRDAVFISLPKAGHGPPNRFLTNDAIREAATMRSTAAAGCAVANPVPITPSWRTVIEFLDRHMMPRCPRCGPEFRNFGNFGDRPHNH